MSTQQPTVPDDRGRPSRRDPSASPHFLTQLFERVLLQREPRFDLAFANDQS